MLIKAALFLCVVLSTLLHSVIVQAEVIKVRFDQLEELAQAHSPGSKIIDLELERITAEHNQILQWSNPELAYDQEKVEESEEFQVVLSKEFSLPWSYSKTRSGWKDRLEAAKLQGVQNKTTHLSNLRAGYVTVQLNQQYLDRLEKLRDIMADASHVATSRHTEGHLSGVEEHLIQMVVISLNASYQEAIQKQRIALSSWRANMGFVGENSLELDTDIEYQPLTLQPVDYYANLFESQPGLQAGKKLQKGLSKLAEAERASFIPSINLYGGYKEINSTSKGLVAGVSLSIPLFNRNRAASEQYEVESNIVGYETQRYRSQAMGFVKALVESIKESQGMLTLESEHFTKDDEALNTLVYTYEEGWMSLNDLLNAIQIEVGGLKDYYSQLEQHYINLFKLEALVGESLVSFK